MGESTNAIRLELNKFEKAGLINSIPNGNKKIFSANTSHPLFREIHNILLKHIGIDQIINDDDVLPLHFTDDIHHLSNIVLWPTLINNHEEQTHEQRHRSQRSQGGL